LTDAGNAGVDGKMIFSTLQEIFVGNESILQDNAALNMLKNAVNGLYTKDMTMFRINR